MARPSKYDPLITPVLARALAREGHTDEEIAARLEPAVGVTTLSRWKVEHPEFREALNEGKAIVDARVEDSLLQRALGFTVTDTRLEAKADDFGRPMKGGKVIKTTRQVSPDVTACIYWLKNRKPRAWRDRQDVLLQASKEGMASWLEAVKFPAPQLAEVYETDEQKEGE
jgi:hypothetical protein